MEKIKIKYRTWFRGQAPRPIKLEIPGWAGEQNNHTNGDKPQPWHCVPFIEGSTYALELVYPFDTECHIKNINGKIIFDGDFSEENKLCPDVKLPPFLSFAPGHFGMTSSLDIQVPTDFVLRTEPHPRFYTDITGTVPCCLAGHIQTEWWPSFFFVVFKNPLHGQSIIFRKNEPYGQILVLPRKASYDIQEMSNEEKTERGFLDSKISSHFKKFAKNDWLDHLGNNFSDKYKQLLTIFNKSGSNGVKTFLSNFSDAPLRTKVKGRPIFKKKKNESV